MEGRSYRADTLPGNTTPVRGARHVRGHVRGRVNITYSRRKRGLCACLWLAGCLRARRGELRVLPLFPLDVACVAHAADVEGKMPAKQVTIP